MAIQLDLFSGVSLCEPIQAPTESEYIAMAQRADIVEAVIDYNPCRNCRYNGLCDSDECAMKCFALDSRVKTNGYSYKYGF